MGKALNWSRHRVRDRLTKLLTDMRVNSDNYIDFGELAAPFKEKM